MPRKRLFLAWALAAGLPLAAQAQAPATAGACADIPIVGRDAAAVSTPSAATAAGAAATRSRPSDSAGGMRVLFMSAIRRTPAALMIGITPGITGRRQPRAPSSSIIRS